MECEGLPSHIWRVIIVTNLQQRICQKIEQLSDWQLKEVLMYIEFLNIHEDNDFIDYVNKRTEQALNIRKRGSKFRSLKDLQKEFIES